MSERMREILGTGMAFPLDVDASGRVALVSDETDVDQAIRLIIGTAPGERPMRPDFGCDVHAYVFERVDAQTTGRIENAIRSALDRWEPRIVVEGISFGGEQSFDTDNSGVLSISVQYRIKATNSVRNLVYPFYVIPAEDEP
jgi:phage baseplate assembly protein W